jgi:peptidase E
MPCLGFLPGANCPHYDSEPARRPTLRRLAARGALPESLAADDGVALHFVGTRLAKVVSSRPRAKAYRVRELRGRAVETRLPTKYLGARKSTK